MGMGIGMSMGMGMDMCMPNPSHALYMHDFTVGYTTLTTTISLQVRTHGTAFASTRARVASSNAL